MEITRICATAYFVGEYFVIRGDLGDWKAFDRRPGEQHDTPVAFGSDLDDVVTKLQSLTRAPNVQ